MVKLTHGQDPTKRIGFENCNNRTPDIKVLKDKANSFLPNLSIVNINDVIMNFNGDKFKAAFELTKQQLGSQGTVQEYKKAYTRNLNNLNRYLSGERRPSKEVRERFKKLVPVTNIKDLKVSIRGCVKVSSHYYYKGNKWTNPIIIPFNKVEQFINLASKDIVQGYGMLNASYMRSNNQFDYRITWLDNVEIDFSF